MTAVEQMRRAEPGDVDAVAAIDASTSSSPWSADSYAGEFAADDGRWFVACENNIVGFVGARLLAGDAHLMKFAVAPARQRIGVGRLLLDHLLSVLDADGVAVTLEVRATNKRVRRLYRHVGFQEVGTRPGYYAGGADAVIAWRNPSHDEGVTDRES